MSSTNKSQLLPSVLLTHESVDEYAAVVQNLTKRYRPQSHEERAQLTFVVDAYWRVVRAKRLEAKLVERVTRDAADPDEALLDLITGIDSAIYQKLLRHQAQVEQAWRRALKDFERTQSKRVRSAPATCGEDELSAEEMAVTAPHVEDPLRALHGLPKAPAPKPPGVSH